uniref:Peroxin-19 n=1 Tax=Angiostrongylus cantonensis TaxID=6313 RepID=A0A0K0D9I2_ANGCA
MANKASDPPMKDSQDVESLSELLDDALKGFTERPRTTDDELDEIMAEHDQAAAQKAAGDFQAMLQQMVKVQEPSWRAVERYSGIVSLPFSFSTAYAVSNSQIFLFWIANATSHDDFIAGLDVLKSPDSPMEPVMSIILQTLASKTVMYPPLKEIHDNYPSFFAEHGASLDCETRQRYKKQYEILGKICREFENQPDDSQDFARCSKGSVEDKVKVLRFSIWFLNAFVDSRIQGDMASNPSQMSNFEVLGKLLVELQSYGYPPKELTGELPAGWAVDDSTGLPKISDHLSSEVVKVDFGNTKKTGLSRNDHVVVGKGKKGGLHLQKETRICVIHCKDGEEVIVRAGVRGVLVEVNERLIDNPDLVRTAPENQGYIAIIAFGAGKRKPDEFVTELPEKRALFRDYETCYLETNGSNEDEQLQ